MKPPVLERMWESFLLVEAHEEAQPPSSALAQAVMGHVRHDILPLVRHLEKQGVIEWYSFLLHGAPEGAKMPQSVYLHLRVSLTPGRHPSGGIFSHFMPPKWECTRVIVAPECREIAGLNRSMLRDEDITRAWWLIGLQAEWLLQLVEQHAGPVTNLQILNHVVQFMHYFSNMTTLPDRLPDWFQSNAPPKHVYWLRIGRALKALRSAILGRRG